ncbi:MAG: hypothetical protein HOG19_14160 [Gammaproteobacteria bacterium]|jgi:hypothetical protein|nr:hypothetical protein [Gammaproteobacteria bacterium]
MIEPTEELIACAVSVVRKRLGRKLSEDAKQSIALHVCYRCSNATATPALVIWRGACDYLAEQKRKVLQAESEHSEEHVAQCHEQWLQADRARVESLLVGKRYGVSGRYGDQEKSFAPSLPYETASRNRWFNLHQSQVSAAAGAVTIGSREDADGFAAFFESRAATAVES